MLYCLLNTIWNNTIKQMIDTERWLKIKLNRESDWSLNQKWYLALAHCARGCCTWGRFAHWKVKQKQNQLYWAGKWEWWGFGEGSEGKAVLMSWKVMEPRQFERRAGKNQRGLFKRERVERELQDLQSTTKTMEDQWGCHGEKRPDLKVKLIDGKNRRKLLVSTMHCFPLGASSRTWWSPVFPWWERPSDNYIPSSSKRELSHQGAHGGCALCTPGPALSTLPHSL